jgi:NAD(P)-dependent dehydrogenase (short-subunit alcohol dehydrogenase family)
MKTVLITGATSGIGKATAKALAEKAFQIVFIARNREKAEEVKKEIVNASKNNNVDYIIANLASKKSTTEGAETFIKTYSKLDVLINNAGVCLPEKRITEDGLEETFQINHLTYFMMACLLLETLKKSDDPRIINVSSAGHRSGKFDLQNLQSENKFSPFGTYCDTKLLNILFTLELARRLKDTGITVNALHPGVVNTNFAGEFKGIYGFLYGLGKPFLLSPQKGAATSIYLATSDEVRNVTGKYFVKCKITEPDNEDITPENCRILWYKSLQLSGLQPAELLKE